MALAPTGDFSLVVSGVSEPVKARLLCANRSTAVYLSPGDQLQLTLDFPRFDKTLRYTGRGANANNYLARSLYTFEYGPAGPIPRPQDQLTGTTTPDQVRRDADAFRRAQQTFLTAYAAAHTLSGAFMSDATAHIDLQWARTLLEYPEQHEALTQTAAVLPATYYDFLAQLSPHTLDPPVTVRDRGVDDNTLAFFCMRAYVHRLLPSGKLSTDPAEAERLYALATAEVPNVAARDVAMLMLLSGQLQTNLPGVEAAYPAFRAYNQDSGRSRDMRRMLVQQRQLQPGREAPAFTLLDHRGKNVSLADFKGQVIYIDFWATWCGPCMAEMPASNALKRQFVGRDVVFLYIDSADPEPKWKQTLTTARLTGPSSVHLRSPDQAVLRAYNVPGVPAYVLIGRDGRIRLANAPRPSAGAETVAALEEALQN